MIRVQNISALIVKQLKDTLKNMPVMMLFIVYPCIALVMTQAMKDQAGSPLFFIAIFATMHCVFAPIVSISSILSEEKETNTLRVLIMSNVTLREYFISIGGFVLLANLATGCIFIFAMDKTVTESLIFLVALGGGCLISIIIGICIGLYAKNASAASGVAVPFSMVFSFLPMLSNFNKGIESVARFTYSQQISYLFSGKDLTVFGACVIGISFILFVLLASYLYQRSLKAE